MSSSDKTETVELHTFQWISVVLRVVKTLMDNVRVYLSNMQKRTVKTNVQMYCSCFEIARNDLRTCLFIHVRVSCQRGPVPSFVVRLDKQ